MLMLPSMAMAEAPKIHVVPYAGLLTSDADSNKTHKIPFPGILLDKTAWAKIQAQKDVHKKELELKDLEKLRAEIKKDAIIADLKTELKWTIKTYEERIKVKDQYTKRLEEMIKKEESKIDWVPWAFVGGVVIGAVASIAIAFAVNESK
jgi:hypothetical protein